MRDDGNAASGTARVAEDSAGVLPGMDAVDDGDHGVGAVADDTDGGFSALPVEPALGQDCDAPHRRPAFPGARTTSLLNGTTPSRVLVYSALPTHHLSL